MFVQVHFDTYVKEKWNFLNSQCSLFGHAGCGSGLVPHLQTREVTGRWAYYFLQPVQTQTRKRTWGPSLSFLFSFIEVIAILKWSKSVHANYLSKEQNSKWSKSCHEFGLFTLQDYLKFVLYVLSTSNATLPDPTFVWIMVQIEILLFLPHFKQKAVISLLWGLK